MASNNDVHNKFFFAILFVTFSFFLNGIVLMATTIFVSYYTWLFFYFLFFTILNHYNFMPCAKKKNVTKLNLRCCFVNNNKNNDKTPQTATAATTTTTIATL